MGLFGFGNKNETEKTVRSEKVNIKDQKFDDAEYRSTMKADDPKILSLLDKNISVIIKSEGSLDHFIDYGIYICFSGQAVGDCLKKLRSKKGETVSAVIMRLGTALRSVFDRQDCRAAFLIGLDGERQVLAKRDLEEIKELLEGYEVLYRRAVGEITNEQAFEALRKRFVYVVGTLPRPDENGVRHLTQDIDVEKFEWTGDDARTSALCYLDKRTARLGRPNALTSSIRLGEFAEGFGSVILEAKSGNWIEFKASELDLI